MIQIVYGPFAIIIDPVKNLDEHYKVSLFKKKKKSTNIYFKYSSIGFRKPIYESQIKNPCHILTVTTYFQQKE